MLAPIGGVETTWIAPEIGYDSPAPSTVNRWKGRQVLECVSPLAISYSGRLPHCPEPRPSQGARGLATPKHERALKPHDRGEPTNSRLPHLRAGVRHDPDTDSTPGET